MTSNVTYVGQLRTTATHQRSGIEIITDAPVDNNGKGEAFSPTDLVATALPSCMLTIMGIRANKMEVDIDGTTADVTKIMASNPRRVAEVIIDFVLPDNGSSDRNKEILEKAAKTCPVALSLHPDVKQTISFTWK